MSYEFRPFENETAVACIDGLSIENRMDRVTLVGDLDITFDAEGLSKAIKLKSIIDQAVAKLTSEKNLPEKLEIASISEVKNPFLE